MPKAEQQILVIGGGISGITAAIEAAETGYKVIQIEKLSYLGGKVIQFSKYFPKLCPPACGLEINYQRIKRNPNITILTSTEVQKITGSKGDFLVILSKQPEMVTTDCTSCGECEKVCPETRSDEFNLNFSTTKAIYLPHDMAYPWRYTIDEHVCKKESCGKCAEVCKYNAINLFAEKEELHLQVASVIIATGWDSYPAANIDNLNYRQYKDVITNLEMERLLASNGPAEGNLFRLSDNEKVNSIAFVQCAGSRDEKHQVWCSGVCCSASLKQSLIFTGQNTEAKSTIYYIDLRVTGRNEDFLEKVEENNQIELVKGKVAGIAYNVVTKKYIVEAEDIEAGKKICSEYDMVVLATGIKSHGLPAMQNIIDDFGFVDPFKLPDGIYATGCCVSPMDVSSSVINSTGTVLKAIQVVNNTN